MELSGDDAQYLSDVEGALIRIAERLAGDASTPAFDLPMSHVRCLHMIASNEGSRLMDIAKSAGMTLPGASRAVERLVRIGMVLRQTDEVDRRAIRLYVSPETRKTLDSINAHRIADLRDWLSTLSADERQTVRAGLLLFAQAGENNEPTEERL